MKGQQLERVLKEQLEQARERLGERLAHRKIPELAYADIEFLLPDGRVVSGPGLEELRGTELHRGLGATYAVRLRDPTALDGIVAPRQVQRNAFILKRQDQLYDLFRHLDPAEQRAVCTQAARSIWMADQPHLRENPRFELTRAYAFTSHGELVTLTCREDMDLEMAMEIITTNPVPRLIAARLGIPEREAADLIDALKEAYPDRRPLLRNALVSGTRAALEYQEADLPGLNIHGDIKPSSFVINVENAVRLARAGIKGFLERDAQSPFLKMIDWDTAYLQQSAQRVSQGATTIYGRPLWSPFYVAWEDLIEHDPQRLLRKLRDPIRDTVAMGWTAMVLAGKTRPSSGLDVTVLQHRDDMFRQRSEDVLEEQLKHVALHATRKGYPRMRQMHEDLIAVYSGLGGQLVKRTDLRRSWSRRRIPEHRLAKHNARVRVVKRTAAAAAAAAGLVLGHDLLAIRNYLEAYERSPQQMARKAATNNLSEESLRAYEKAWIEQLLEDDRTLYMPHRSTAKPFPAWSFPTLNEGRLRFWSGQDFVSGAVIQEYLSAYLLSKDRRLVPPLAFYLSKLQPDLSSRDHGDIAMSAVARFEPVIYHWDELSRLRSAGDTRLAEAIDTAMARARYGAIAGAHQFMNLWTEPETVTAYDEYMLFPLVAATLRHPELLRIPAAPDGRERYPGEEYDLRMLEKQIGELPYHVLVWHVMRSGETVCRGLVDPSGRSFGIAYYRHGTLARRTPSSSRDPGYTLPEADQPVVMAEHAGLQWALAQRILFADDLARRKGLDLEQELERSFREHGVSGIVGYDEFKQGIFAIREALVDCKRRMDRFYDLHVGDGLPPEYIFLTPAAQEGLAFDPLPADARSMAYRLRMLVSERDSLQLHKGVRTLFAQARMRVPQAPGTLLPQALWTRAPLPSVPRPYLSPDGVLHEGLDFPDARGYSPSYRGPTMEAVGPIRVAYREFREWRKKE